jgi:pyridinium-3,5-biscarboxylic acid mononucleotide synthase
MGWDSLISEEEIRKLLVDHKENSITLEQAVQKLRKLPFENLEFARLDLHRGLRSGFPEVIFCQGKQRDHIVAIMERLASGTSPILATRASYDDFIAVKERITEVRYHHQARIIVYEPIPLPKKDGVILVISAGTADIPVADEAAITADVMGNHVERLYDVGVAGLHRLLADLDLIQSASVLIVVAGMEGALPSVVGGLVNRPVIAVPTSIGYGSSFGGLAALLAMLNSCAAGITVVNIDNGFGAGFAANQINTLKETTHVVRSSS